MTKRAPHREQLRIAGTERRDRVPEIDALADECFGFDDEMKAIREARDTAAERLADEMLSRGLRVYVYEDRFGQMQRLTVQDLDVKVKRQRVPAPRVDPTPAVEEQN